MPNRSVLLATTRKAWFRAGGFHVTSSPPCWWTVNKRSLISSFRLSTTICSFHHHCYLCLPILHENHVCGLLTQSSGIFSTSYRLQLNERKVSIGLFSPSSKSFNENAIVRNFYPKKISLFEAFQRFVANLEEICIWSPLIIEPWSTSSRAHHSDYSVTEPINCSTVY